MIRFPKDAPPKIDIDLTGVDLEVIQPDPRNGVILMARGEKHTVALTFRTEQLPILRYLVKCLHQSLNRQLEVPE